MFTEVEQTLCERDQRKPCCANNDLADIDNCHPFFISMASPGYPIFQYFHFSLTCFKHLLLNLATFNHTQFLTFQCHFNINLKNLREQKGVELFFSFIQIIIEILCTFYLSKNANLSLYLHGHNKMPMSTDTLIQIDRFYFDFQPIN